MSNVTEQFVDRLYKLSKLQIPETVIAKAHNCFRDYLAVTIGGSGLYLTRNQKYIESNRLYGNCHIIGISMPVDPRSACLINAFNAHVLELDDSHRVAMTHLGAPIFSALLSVAEVSDKSIDDVIHAAVVGYEAAIRLANAIQPGHKRRGFHVSGTCCTIGAAMGIASLLDFSREEFANVFSASASSAAGLLAVISGKSEQKPYNVAHAAVSGLDAALYGKMFAGAEDILNNSRGFFYTLSDDVRIGKLFEKGYAIEGIYQKLYAACRHCHAPMEAALKLTERYCITVDDIQRIVVHTYDLAIKGHDHIEIQGRSSAKQSIPYGVAAACMYKECGENIFAEDKINNPQLLNLIRKVNIIEDKSLSMMVPDKRAARVEIILKDGTNIMEQVDFPKGEPENPVTEDELEAKFRFLCLFAAFSGEHISTLYQVINNRDQKITELLKIINGGL